MDLYIDDCAVGDSEDQQLVRVEAFAVAFSSIVDCPTTRSLCGRMPTVSVENHSVLRWASWSAFRKPARPCKAGPDRAVPDCAVSYQIEASSTSSAARRSRNSATTSKLTRDVA